MKEQNTYLKCFGYPVFTGDLENISQQGKKVVNTINQYSYCMAEQNPKFKNTLLKSDILLPDGIAIVMASRILYQKKIKKISGADAHISFLRKTNEKGGKCFYLGASEATLKKIEKRCNKEYPKIKIRTYSPPFKKEFSKVDNDKMVDMVNAFEPDILFVGMTAPKQEVWVEDHKNILKASVICSIGAVFDFYAGTVKSTTKNY